jgi:hypothetical protein
MHPACTLWIAAEIRMEAESFEALMMPLLVGGLEGA